MEDMKTIYVRENKEGSISFVVDSFIGADGLLVLQEQCPYCSGSGATHIELRQIEDGEFVPAPFELEEPYEVAEGALDT